MPPEPADQREERPDPRAVDELQLRQIEDQTCRVVRNGGRDPIADLLGVRHVELTAEPRPDHLARLQDLEPRRVVHGDVRSRSRRIRTSVPSSPRAISTWSIEARITLSPRPRSLSRDGRQRPPSRTTISTSPPINCPSISTTPP